ncbi:MAG: permease-like cell division protein FtsX [Actinoplanes sp.]
MDQDLRGLFERALEDEPVPPPGDLAGAAMAQGTRIRRRRTLLAGGGAAAGVVLILAAVLQLTAPAPQPAAPMAAAETPAPAGDACRMPVSGHAAVAGVTLREDVTADQQAAIQSRLHADPLVRVVSFHAADAYTRFSMLWSSPPGASPAFEPWPIPASFLVQLVDPAQYKAFVAGYRGVPGVEGVSRVLCPDVTPSREHE